MRIPRITYVVALCLCALAPVAHPVALEPRMLDIGADKERTGPAERAPGFWLDGRQFLVVGEIGGVIPMFHGVELLPQQVNLSALSTNVTLLPGGAFVATQPGEFQIQASVPGHNALLQGHIGELAQCDNSGHSGTDVVPQSPPPAPRKRLILLNLYAADDTYLDQNNMPVSRANENALFESAAQALKEKYADDSVLIVRLGAGGDIDSLEKLKAHLTSKGVGNDELLSVDTVGHGNAVFDDKGVNEYRLALGSKQEVLTSNQSDAKLKRRYFATAPEHFVTPRDFATAMEAFLADTAKVAVHHCHSADDEAHHGPVTGVAQALANQLGRKVTGYKGPTELKKTATKNFLPEGTTVERSKKE